MWKENSKTPRLYYSLTKSLLSHERANMIVTRKEKRILPKAINLHNEIIAFKLLQSMPVRLFWWAIMNNTSGSFSARFIFSSPLVSQFIFPVVSSPQTENTRSTYALDAAADNRSWASGAKVGTCWHSWSKT